MNSQLEYESRSCRKKNLIINIKKVCAFFGIMLLSFDAFSVGFFTIKLDHLTVTSSDQKAPKGTVLGGGWKVYTPGVGEEMCEAWNPRTYVYSPYYEGENAGLSIYNDSVSYPVLKTSVDGVGIALSVRQLGSLAWHPLSSSSGNSMSTAPNTQKLNLEVKFAYIKTVDGIINIRNDWFISINNSKVLCSDPEVELLSSVGYVRLNGGSPDMDNRTCDVRTPTRQTVNLGTHNLSDIRSLKVGDTFGLAQQQVTIDCPNNMTVYYAVADNNNPENIGKDVILLENESEKPGFGVKMYESGNSSALKLGGDKDFSAQYQYLFVKTGSSDENATKTFDFKYVKTSQNVKAVDGNAQVTLTLMYR